MSEISSKSYVHSTHKYVMDYNELLKFLTDKGMPYPKNGVELSVGSKAGTGRMLTGSDSMRFDHDQLTFTIKLHEPTLKHVK